MTELNNPMGANDGSNEAPRQARTGTALLVPPPMPETLSVPTTSLSTIMQIAVQSFYAEDAEFRNLLSTIQSGGSVTGTVSGDGLIAAQMLHKWCADAGEQYAPLLAANVKLKDFIDLFKKARKKLSIDAASRLKIAKGEQTGVSH